MKTCCGRGYSYAEARPVSAGRTAISVAFNHRAELERTQRGNPCGVFPTVRVRRTRTGCGAVWGSGDDILLHEFITNWPFLSFRVACYPQKAQLVVFLGRVVACCRPQDERPIAIARGLPDRHDDMVADLQ
jgi:hypothetical protein